MSGHIIYANRAVGDRPADHWLRATAQVGAYVNTVSRRSSIVAAIGPGMAYGNPACFVPSCSEIRVDTDMVLPVGIDPGTIDLTDPLWKLEHQTFMGSIDHESAHASHTFWTVEILKDHGADARMIDIITVLEEPRCEAQLLRRARKSRPSLRAAATDLIIKDFRLSDSKYGASMAAGLLLARVDGGTLDADDVTVARDQITGVLGTELLGEFQELWKSFLALGDRNFMRMVDVATKWSELIGEDDGERVAIALLDEPGGTGSNGTNPQPEVEQVEGSKQSESWLDRAIGQAAVRADADLVERRRKERSKQQQAAASADRARREQGEQARDRVYSHGGGTNSSGYSQGSRTPSLRQPTVEERTAATTLAAALELLGEDRAEVDRSPRTSPPGRLIGRAAVRAEAMRANGADRAAQEVEMFRGHTMTVDPGAELTIAQIVDVSGSMAAAAEPMASTQWILSHAASRIGATVAAVHLGVLAYPSLRAHELSEDVAVYECRDGFECFTDAFLAVDAEAGLLDSPGVKLLVIASDAQYGKAPHNEFARAAMTMCKQKGVKVLWLDFTHRFKTTYGHGTVIDVMGMDPVQVAQTVGQAALKEMADARR